MAYPKITAIIPCYNQPDLLARLLANLSRQDYPDLEIVIADDCSPEKTAEEYRRMSERFPSLSVSYRRNPENLGAIPNMIACLTAAGDSEFLICLHEDDLLTPGYLKQAAEILSRDTDIAWVGSPAVIFQPGDDVAPQAAGSANKKYDARALVDLILNGNPFVFGSIVYRRSAIAAKNIDYLKYDVFFDRPFLINTLLDSNRKAALLDEPHYYYQEHPYPDGRYRSLRWENILALYSFYRQIAGQTNPQLAGRYWFDFVNLENRAGASWRNFLRRGRELDLIGCGYDCRFLMAGIFILIFGKRNYDRLFRAIKRRTNKSL